MQADEVMDMMRHARHDWMNEMQLIQGYASMGKMDRVKEKLADVLANADEERRLMNLNAPYLSLWLMSFNWYHPYYRLTYQVKGDRHDLRQKDITLYAQCKEVIHTMENFSDSSVLYHGLMTIEADSEGRIAIDIMLKGKFSNPSLLKEPLEAKEYIESVEIEKTEQYHQVTAKMNVEVKR
ncbi:Spo0B domain-containing protein [Thalassobacillus devorans]|uniref:Spo0B domain-containing protein n=1 Tax=Thalassobacillus devorans TaxID=279813 RepID=UPI00048CF84F|nr:Spo0B domain-containing protein [Thalassobacillus devorans]